MLKKLALCGLIFCASAQVFAAPSATGEEPVTEAIDHVWSGQRVWFDFVEQDNYQMIAYYDASRQMSLAVRRVRDVHRGVWNYHKLPSFLGWDAHNHVEAAFDKNGIIHVVGNIHANHLVYFKSTRPYDPRSLKQVDVMVNAKNETSTTYPEFFKDPQGNLIFKYRQGTSGQGHWFYNKWDADKGAWTALHDSSILHGEGKRGVYPKGPVIGPDGFAHLAYVWRETPIASSNHDLSYARSRDLVNWETSDGTPLTLPITLSTGEVIDPIQQHGGLLNGRTPIGFDADKRVVVTYQKYDENGNTQVFITRKDGDKWVSRQVSTWKNSRVDLDKGGSLDLPIDTSESPYLNADNNLVVPASWRGIRWEWVLDSTDLSVISGGEIKQSLPKSIARFDEDNGIRFRVKPLMEDQSKKSKNVYISWEALQPNRDIARENIPAPSTLRIHYVPTSADKK